ncbi:hypothetical protein H0H87_001645, partial [Tephrocybe sp. NHM501043]
GEDNTVANVMSRIPIPYKEPKIALTPIFSITDKTSFATEIITGYAFDSFCHNLLTNANSDMSATGVLVHDDLPFVGDCLVIPKHANL